MRKAIELANRGKWHAVSQDLQAALDAMTNTESGSKGTVPVNVISLIFFPFLTIFFITILVLLANQGLIIPFLIKYANFGF